MKIYQIDTSARKEGSTSRALAKRLLDKIKKPEDEVVYRDLNDEMIFISNLTESGMKIPEGEQTDQGVRDDPRIVEFPYENARVLVFGLTNIHYNEQKGVALKYFPDKGRWKV